MKQLVLALAVLLLAVTSQAQQTVLATTAPCMTSPYGTWTNQVFPVQTENFEVQFDATPSATGADGVMSLYSTPTPGYNGNTSVPVLFASNGTIQAYNGTAYTAVNTIKYVGGTSYHFTLDVNLSNFTYNAYVGTTTRTLLATNYAFRTSGGKPKSLSAMGMLQDAASSANKICNFTLLSYPVTATHTVTLSWNASIVPVGGTPVTSYTPERGTSSSGPFTPLATLDALMYVDEDVIEGNTYCYTVYATNSGGNSSNATPVCVTVN
jgi:hypothetical protein